MITILVFKYFPVLLAACNKENLHGNLGMMPRGLLKAAQSMGAVSRLTWESRYGSLIFFQADLLQPIGGMNEAGLVVEQTSLDGTLYPDPPGVPAIGEQQLVEYLLDTCQDVHEALLAMHEVTIQSSGCPVHLFLVDRLGDMAVVEFLDWRMHIYRGSDLPLPILTNLSYPEALASIKRIPEPPAELATEAEQRALASFDLAACLWNAFQSAPVHPRRQAFAALDRLAGPDSTCQCVYDPPGLCVYLRMANQDERQEIRLEELDFSPGQPFKIIPID